ncbi:RND transporter [Solimonas sp. K1W22B-7]|uniref:efflux RND transporter permease subunit n=1 Tax=Solimonas sp. K1W22B-7 TaxID=2303331 RepID=UPI000E334BEB|nr:MMPL family transporter [Solimonas sp. K1W22B-7]AXQ30536.1 RND transporter [Solimonas sp. K1W22B-7]
MKPLRFRIAKWVMQHRTASTVLFVLVTLFFAAGLPNVQLKTIFSDLLPKDDPYVQVFKDHPNFGNPLTMTIMVKRKDGDIYNPVTLAKVWKLTRDIDLAPGVDHDQILSIATEKARYAEATPFGIDMRPLMGDRVPDSKAEVADFRRRVEQSPNARTFLISNDGTATLINATFIEQRLDYGEAFDFVHKLATEARDADHEVYVAGQPMLTGWVYHLQSQTFGIFAVTLTALVVALALYMRNIVGVVTPILTSLVAAIWGFGLTGWIKSPIEPLLMVVPLLLVARSFSHCVQFTERYYEVYWHVKDRVKAAEITMGVMMAPSILGIFTDIVGVFLIALAPIPAMERFALFCGFWCIWLIPTGVVLISLLLSALPAPRNVGRLIGKEGDSGMHKAFKKTLGGLSKLTYGKTARLTTAVVAVISIFAVYTALQIRIGNPVEGSSLLWEDSEFNTAVRQINSHFPGVNTLEIVLEAKDMDNPNRVARQAETVMIAQQLQVLMEHSAAPPRADLSFADYMMEGNRLFSGGNPKWYALDPTDRAISAAATAVTFGTNAKNFSHVVDFEQQHSTVSLWYQDNKQSTVTAALAAARDAVAKVGADHKDFTVRLGTGTIALQEATNHVVERYHWVIIGLLNLVIFIGTSWAYRSLVAGLILLFPVNLANFILNASMHMIGIGLDINSLMVAAIGVGVGIDYGIYLLSRICEEFHAHDQNWSRAIDASLTTTGKAIMFTASIMFIGIVPWYFLSALKFMADMGLLLTLTMLINMVLALVVLPLLVWLVKPEFVKRKDLLVGEGVDLSLFTESGDGTPEPETSENQDDPADLLPARLQPEPT